MPDEEVTRSKASYNSRRRASGWKHAAGEEQALLMSKMTTKPRSNSASVMLTTGAGAEAASSDYVSVWSLWAGATRTKHSQQVILMITSRWQTLIPPDESLMFLTIWVKKGFGYG